MRIIATIARYTAVEALHTRLPLLVGCVILVLGAASLFAAELAIAEGARFQAAIYAAGVRLACPLRPSSNSRSSRRTAATSTRRT